jgi:hypothetical protein
MMVYFNTAFLIFGLISAAWFVCAAGWRAWRWRRGAPFWTKTVRRTFIMAVVWLLSATLLHHGMTRAEPFRDQLPATVLQWDVQREFYGRLALSALTKRSIKLSIDRRICERITDTLLDAQWWRAETIGVPFDPKRPAEDWLTVQMEQGRLTEEQLARWIQIVTPPLFSAGVERETFLTEHGLPARAKSSDANGEPKASADGGLEAHAPDDEAIVIRAVFGRQWMREARVPYRVDRLEVREIRINGEAREFAVEEADGSQSGLGQFATRVEFIYRVAPPDEPRAEVEIDYVLDLEPSGYVGIGPMTWRTALIVN